MNEVILIGRLGNKPEVSETKNGTKVATISLPLFHSYSPDSKETEWIQCQALGKLANVVEMAEKGVMVSIRGELNNQKWKDEDGKWKNRAFVKIDSFRFLEKKKESGDVGSTQTSNKHENNGQGNNHSETPSANDIDNFLDSL